MPESKFDLSAFFLTLFSICLFTTSAQAERLNISVYGHVYEAELSENHELVNKLNLASDEEQGQHYRGRLLGFENSWVRASKIDERWQGVLSLEGVLYTIDVPAEETPVSGQDDVALILKQSLTQSLVSASPTSAEVLGSCGTHTAGTASEVTLELMTAESHSVLDGPEVQEVAFSSLCASTVNGVCLIAELEFAFDLAFQQDFSGNAQSQAVALINIVEGYYRNDFNIIFDTLSMEFLTSELFSTTTVAGDLLDDVSDKKGNGSLPFIQNQRALFHLVTGRNFDGGTAGIAFVDVLCRANGNGVGVSQVLENFSGPSISRTALVVAHEIGHNFGADHDGEGNACGNGFIMASSVSSAATGFSTCSVTSIQTSISNVFNPAQCFDFPADLSLTADAANPTDVSLNEPFVSQYQVQLVRGFQAVPELTVTGSIPAGQGLFTEVRLGGQLCTLLGGGVSYQCSLLSPPATNTLIVSATALNSSMNLTQNVVLANTSDIQDVNTANNQLTTAFAATGPVVPSAPSGLALSQGTGTSVRAVWADNSVDETGFIIQRRQIGGSFAQVGQVSANMTAFTDSSVAASVRYEYVILAFNGNGNSPPSVIAVITVQAPAASGGGGGGGSLGWPFAGLLMILAFISRRSLANQKTNQSVASTGVGRADL